MPLHADASAKIASESTLSSTSPSPSPSPSFTPRQIAAADPEAALHAYGVEAAGLAPGLLPHMAVLAAGLSAPLLDKGAEAALAAVFAR